MKEITLPESLLEAIKAVLATGDRVELICGDDGTVEARRVSRTQLIKYE